MVKNRRSLLDSCHEAFWSFPDDSLSSDRRIAAILQAVAENPLADRSFLFQTARSILMADIAMCSGHNCPIKEDCWRFMAPPERFQSYFGTPPFTEEGCDYFWDMNEK
jgi:hypothetical protein